MTASDRSFIGFAKQAAKGTPQTTDDNFSYILFTRGQAGVNNMAVPLDPEVGGGAVIRDVIKAGYTSGGQVEFIPRPESLGHMLHAMTGVDTLTAGGSALLGYEHNFTLNNADNFSAPYYTVRYAPGNMWGETYEDCRFNNLALSWRGANFVRGAVSFIGGKATPDVVMTTWAPGAKVDGTPPFITPISTIELPTGTSVKCLAGSFQATSAIPLDGQMIVGSYLPDDFDIVSRAYIMQLTLKVTSAALYNKLTYDGDMSGAAWAADMMRESAVNILFKSSQIISGATSQQYQLKITGNGTAAQNGNIVWTAQPLGLRAGQQVILNVTGVFLQDIAQTIKASLYNGKSALYSA